MNEEEFFIKIDIKSVLLARHICDQPFAVLSGLNKHAKGKQNKFSAGMTIQIKAITCSVFHVH